MYITGGIGPSRHNEGFTTDYDLPDETAYAETCATIGLVMWNHRLLQFNGERRFADVLERGLYNGFLSGVSLEGTHFLYENPLSSAGDRHRQEWFICPCCPPNVARILASVGNYFYSTGPEGVWVHLFAGNTAELRIGNQPVKVSQATQYPWDGKVTFTLEMSQPQGFTLHLRLPGWCEKYTLKVNGQAVEVKPDANGYLAITRTWGPGDQVFYDMDMPIRAVWANPAVRQLEGRLALQRGPLVYCLESVDHGGASTLDRVAVSTDQVLKEFTAEFQPGLLGGVTVIHGRGTLIDDQGWDGQLYRSLPPIKKEIALTAVPYCVWDNRTPGEMRVWLRAT
jgi:uncharacterized protein